MRSTLCIASVVFFAACSTSDLRPVDPTPLADLGEVIEGEVIINTDVPVDLQESLGLEQLDFDNDLGAGLYFSNDGVNLETIAATIKGKLRNEAIVVENNRPVRSLSLAKPNDAYRSLQWDMDMLGIDAAHGIATGKGVTVAIIDTGVSAAGDDTPVNLVQGYDYVDGDMDSTDLNSHGTHVAGTIAQATDNGYGVEGMAPDATILAVRVLDANGAGSAYDSAKGITWAVNNGADVINMSLGSSSSTSTERDAVADAIARGVVVVAASGNEYKSTVSYPAAYDGVIAVGAVGGDKKVAAYSNGGSALDVVAPGGNMELDYNKDGYADGILQETFDGRQWGFYFFEGTSMACPHVAGLAALLLSAGADPSQVDDLITSTADDVGTAGWDTRAGAGLINPVRALNAIGNSNPPSGGGSGGGSGSGSGSTDTTKPTISNVAGSRYGTSLTISWTTNEPTTGSLRFDTYGTFVDDGGLATYHEMAFTIDKRTTYYFTVTATDGAGNVAENGTWVSYP